MHVYYLFRLSNMCVFFFFFSSRRRHTRCLSDWSSDVCSSDLGYETKVKYIDISDPQGSIKIRGEAQVPGRVQDRWSLDEYRSEERRVGKECRSRWWPYQ